MHAHDPFVDSYFYPFISSYSLGPAAQSVNVVSGVPLTLPEYALESMGLKPHENTGGWGDVMANVGMALEIKKQFPEVQLRGELNDKVYGKSKNLVEKWYALFTLWETGLRVESSDVATVLNETAVYLKQKKTEANYEIESQIFGILEQINGSIKSKYSLYQAIKNDSSAYAQFSEIRKTYNAQNIKPLTLSRQNSCEKFYSN
ncbi:MAG: hypothetical protein B7Y39_00380 [Bdellovibrio sp. 28-41-41]|nr:MAG: hypothetical protein B7Y39_00380 [Bdellovibrio sp. 28-41-41]